jgi:DNA (cytosine-5)-methyltransferase 1
LLTQPLGAEMELVLSLFPGIGLLDLAFEETGFSVVRGPDLLWGGDIRRFHAPAGKFDGVIGGPPCQAFSPLRHFVEFNGYAIRYGNQIPEFCRVIGEAAPRWFLMENVPQAPDPAVDGYAVEKLKLNNRWFGDGIGAVQRRERCFWFGSRAAVSISRHIEFAVFEAMDWSCAVTRHPAPGQRRSTGSTMPIETMCELQGLPADFTAEMPFTVHGKQKALANGVPLPMGKAIAAAIARVLQRAK